MYDDILTILGCIVIELHARLPLLEKNVKVELSSYSISLVHTTARNVFSHQKCTCTREQLLPPHETCHSSHVTMLGKLTLSLCDEDTGVELPHLVLGLPRSSQGFLSQVSGCRVVLELHPTATQLVVEPCCLLWCLEQWELPLETGGGKTREGEREGNILSII